MGNRHKLKPKLVCGVGINDANYQVSGFKLKSDGRVCACRCPYYEKWYQMLRRCHSKNRAVKFPNYEGCSVCEEWLYFSNFKEWMEGQNWEDRQLDKDFLIEGNKVYNPDTCVFIPQELNKFITTGAIRRGKIPTGCNL